MKTAFFISLAILGSMPCVLGMIEEREPELIPVKTAHLVFHNTTAKPIVLTVSRTLTSLQQYIEETILGKAGRYERIPQAGGFVLRKFGYARPFHNYDQTTLERGNLVGKSSYTLAPGSISEIPNFTLEQEIIEEGRVSKFPSERVQVGNYDITDAILSATKSITFPMLATHEFHILVNGTARPKINILKPTPAGPAPSEEEEKEFEIIKPSRTRLRNNA